MANSILNTSGITTDASGKVRISGLSSSIDSKAIIDAQIQAKRQPAVQIETKITKNTELANAYKELKTKTGSLTTSLNALRSAPGSTVDVFNTKLASGTTAAASGAPSGYTPSGIDSLLLTSIGSTAQTGTQSIRITQLAQAQQVRSDSIGSSTASLASLGFTTGTFSLGGQTVTISATDTLQDLRANINAAGAGVTATVVSASATENYLVLTSSQTGTANTLNFAGGNAVSNGLGLTLAGVVKTELVQAKDAIINVNGITGITRSSNTIDDVLTGITLNLLKAEPNTDITLKIEPDLNSIKTAIGDFVEAYNSLRDYFAAQRTASDRNGDGEVADDELGVLAYDQRLRDIMSRLSEVATTSLSGNADGFRSLGQIGITLESDYKLKVNDATLDSRLLANVGEIKKLFGFSATSTDSRATVLSRTAATQTGTYYLNVGGTDSSSNLLSANIQNTAGVGTGGADNGTASVAGQQISTLTGNATGLGIFFNGGASLGAVDGITLTVSRGIADQFYDFFNDQSLTSVGALDIASSTLLNTNTDLQARIDDIDDRLVFLRASLEARFTTMETALAQLETLRSTIDSYFNANNSSGN